MLTSRSSHHSGPWPALLLVTLMASALPAQIEIRAPIGIQKSVDPESPPSEDPGPAPRLFESANVDRFLRRAQEALSRGDDRSAIRILQDVIEGRTLEEAEPAGVDPAESGETEVPVAVPEPSAPEHAVFSTDDRLYRPVRRLCHELLAALPAESILYYRTLYEVPAERALEDAIRGHDAGALEQVVETWFVTRAAARAMVLAGDLRMDAGAYRAAIRNYLLLLDVYPDDARREAGVSEAWLQFKIAYCLTCLGDDRSAREQLESLARERPDATLRIAGELHAVADLPDARWFDARETDGNEPAMPVAIDAGAVALRGPRETLVALWEYRFVDPQPYRPAKGSEERRLVIGLQNGKEGASASPRPAQFAPGTSVNFHDGAIAFLDHYRLRRLELPSGRAISTTDGPVEQPRPKPGVPRVRIAAYDHVAQRVVTDGTRDYAVIGPGRTQLPDLRPLLDNDLEAFSPDTGARLWTTDENEDFTGVTFLAAPTIAGDRLLIPTLRGRAFGMDCLDPASGALLFHVPLHAEGTELARPVTPPVVVDAGIAFLATGAGAIGAIDVHTGTLRWIRRYERIHPLRARPRVRPRPDTNRMLFGAGMFVETDLDGFAPSDLIVRDGLVVLAPCDSNVLSCLDGSTGQPVWMLSRGEMQYLIGADERRLFVGAPDGVYCVGLHTGVRLWRKELPPHHRSMEWRGRGAVGHHVLALPGEQAIHVLPIAKDGDWATLPLPGFGFGREPLDGRFNVQLDGPWVVAVHEGGVQLFSTVEAMQSLADAAEDPFERALVLAQVGDLLGAVAALESIDLAARPELRDGVERRMLAWCGELAIAMATHGEREAALAALERCRPSLTDAELERRWRLERIEVFRALGDVDAIAREQDALLSLPKEE